MKRNIKRYIKKDAFFKLIADSSIWRNSILGTELNDIYKVEKVQNSFMLRFHSFSLFEILQQVYFVFNVKEEANYYEVRGHVQVNWFMYISIVFAALVFILMMYLDNRVDVVPLMFIIVLLIVSFTRIKSLKKKFTNKVNDFFSLIEG